MSWDRTIKFNGHASIYERNLATRNAPSHVLTPARITLKRVVVRLNGERLTFDRITGEQIGLTGYGRMYRTLANVTEGSYPCKP